MLATSILKRSTICYSEKENAGTPEDQRVQELKRRFNHLGVSVEKTKKLKIEQMEENLSKLEKSIYTLVDDETVLRTKKFLNELQDKTEEVYIDKDNFENGFQKRLNGITDDFRLNLDEIRADNRTLVSEFAKQGTDRIFALGLNLAKNQRTFQEQLDSYTLGVEEKIEGMREQIERENQEREERAENVEIKIMAELDRLEEDLEIERKVREETNTKIKSLIDDMGSELAKKIEVERREREQSNNSLLMLLEEACNRIERNFSTLL
jgi:hypothetical protein